MVTWRVNISEEGSFILCRVNKLCCLKKYPQKYYTTETNEGLWSFLMKIHLSCPSGWHITMKIITKEEADGIKFLFRHHAIHFHFGTEI